MKITKHGKKFEKKEEKFEDFKCDNCGCEFSVKADEYYVDKGGKDEESYGTLSGSISISSYIQDYYVCSCPECHKIVKKVSSRLNTNYGNVTVTGMSTETNVTSENPYPTRLATRPIEEELAEMMKA